MHLGHCPALSSAHLHGAYKDCILRVATTFGHHSFSVAEPDAWNSLPDLLCITV